MQCIDQAYISLFGHFWHIKGDFLAETLSHPIRLRDSLSSKRLWHVLHPLLHQGLFLCVLTVPIIHMWQLLSIAFPKSSTLASLLTLIAVPRIQYLAPKCSFCNLLLAQITEHWKLASVVSVVIIALVRWGHPIPSTWILSILCKYSQLYIILHMVIALNAHAILPSLLTKKDHMLHTGERYALPIASSQCTMLRLL